MQHDSDFAGRLSAIRRRFITRVADWLPSFEALRRDLNAGMSSAEDLSKLRMQVHKIAGTAHTFGFSGFTHLAAELEEHLVLALDGAGHGDPGLLARALENFVVAAQHVAGAPPMGDGDPGEDVIPLDPPAQVEAAIPVPAEGRAPPPARAPHVLIVDDDDLIRDLLTDGLATRGWVFSEAVNGKEAILSLMRASGAAPESRPDMILMDVDMPEMNGFEALGIIKASPLWRATPVVMLTQRDDDINVIRGYAGGVQDYMTKPVDLAAVAAKIAATLAARTRRIVVTMREGKTRGLLKDCLDTLPVQVIFARDAEEAVEQLRDDRTALALVDLSPPGTEGHALLERVRNDDHTRHIPVITLVAAGDRDTMLDSLAGGARASLMKPLDAETLVAQVQGILLRAEG